MIRENLGEALDYPNVIKESGVLGCFHIPNSACVFTFPTQHYYAVNVT